MWPVVVLGLVVVFGVLFVIALCRAAADGDRAMEAAQWDWRPTVRRSAADSVPSAWYLDGRPVSDDDGAA